MARRKFCSGQCFWTLLPRSGRPKKFASIWVGLFEWKVKYKHDKQLSHALLIIFYMIFFTYTNWTSPNMNSLHALLKPLQILDTCSLIEIKKCEKHIKDFQWIYTHHVHVRKDNNLLIDNTDHFCDSFVHAKYEDEWHDGT